MLCPKCTFTMENIYINRPNMNTKLGINICWIQHDKCINVILKKDEGFGFDQGLRHDDSIVSLNGVIFRSVNHFKQLVGQVQSFHLKVRRNQIAKT
jgi:hypothetical protein